MGYVLWPATASISDVLSYDFWQEWCKALRETASIAAGTPDIFPRSCTPYWIGTVASCTETTLTDADAATDIWALTGGCTGKKFYNLVCSGSEHVPQFYDVIFSKIIDDQRYYFRTNVTDNDDDGNLTFSSIAINKDVYKQINSYSELNGTTYWIVPRAGVSGVGQWWNDRWITPPSGAEGSGSATAVAANLITDTTKNLSNISGDIIFYSSGSLVRRAITGVDGSDISIGGAAITPDGGTSYWIVPTGAIYFPRTTGTPFRWYGGATESIVSIMPDGTAGSLPHPVSTVSWQEGPISCEEVSHPAFDIDLWSLFDEQCSTADRTYSPNFYKAPIRASQAYLEGICASFVPDISYDGAKWINPFTAATAFYHAGINAYQTSATVTSGSATFTVSLPTHYSSISMYYEVFDHRDRSVESGVTSTSGTITVSGIDSAYNGETWSITYSYGWTRKLERQVRYPYPHEYMTAPRNGDGDVITTPTDTVDGTGVWTVVDASEYNQEHDDYGYPVNGLELISTGQDCRYVGSSPFDGTINGASYTSTPDDFDWIKYSEFWLDQDVNIYTSSKSGTITGGTTKQLSTDKSWWKDGSLRTEEGTATGGSTTTLSDTAKAGSYFWDPATGRWATFILEVEVSSGVWEARPIASHSGTTLTVSEAFSTAIVAGMSYRIIEPMPSSRKNRWKGRTVLISNGETSYERTISHSDNNRLYWSEALPTTVADGWTFQILEPVPGEVIRKTSSGWSIIDTNRDLTGDILTRYGKARKNDFITANLFNQLYAYRNKLTAIKRTHSWTNNEEENVRTCFRLPFLITWTDGDAYGYDEAEADARLDAETAWTDNVITDYLDDTRPGMTTQSISGDLCPANCTTGYISYATGTRIAAYPKATSLPTWMSSVATFYAMGGIDVDDSEEGDIQNGVSDTYEFNRFDPQNSGLSYRLYKAVGSVSGTDATRISSTRIGPASMDELPDWIQPEDPFAYSWPSVPPNEYMQALLYRTGFTVINEAVVLSFASSMEYQPVVSGTDEDWFFWWF